MQPEIKQGTGLMGDNVRKRARPLMDETTIRPNDTTLIIGDLARWNAEGRAPVSCENFQFSDLKSLSAEVFEELSPTIILSPLFGDDFDVIDIAIRLNELKYAGQYRAITEDLPDSNMVRKEVRAQAPNLDFDLLMMPRIANDG